MASCHEERLIFEKWDTYTIKKGNHFSGLHILRFAHNTLKFDAVFDSSCIYKTDDPNNQSDINKLFGFSDCGSINHHENSARFGWNWYNGRLNIYAYCYSGGTVKNKLITSVELNKEYEYRIYKQDYKYIFEINGKSVEMDRHCNEGNGNLLYFYFGGNSVPDHDVSIKIRYLK